MHTETSIRLTAELHYSTTEYRADGATMTLYSARQGDDRIVYVEAFGTTQHIRRAVAKAAAQQLFSNGQWERHSNQYYAIKAG